MTPQEIEDAARSMEKKIEDAVQAIEGFSSVSITAQWRDDNGPSPVVRSAVVRTDGARMTVGHHPKRRPVPSRGNIPIEE